MKTSFTTYFAAIALTATFFAGEAFARGGGSSSMGGGSFSHPSSSFGSQSSSFSRPTTSFNSQAGSIHNNTAVLNNKVASNGPSNNGVAKTSQLNTSKLTNTAQFNKQNGLNKINKTNNQNGLNNINNANKVAKTNGQITNKGSKGQNSKSFNKYYCKDKCWPCNFWCGFGCGCFGFGCGDWCCDDYCCCEPWCSPCYNVCYEYVQPCYTPSFSADPTPVQPFVPGPTPTPEPTPVPGPVAQTVHLVNPAETQATLGFAVNGQTYSLDAGQSQDIQINDGAVIEFDRGSDNQTGRYALTAGEYRFASTPQGWELLRQNGAAADSVAAN